MDLDDLPLRPLASVIVGVFRILVWLWSEFLFDTLGWRIGWCVCRVLSFGQLPKVGFTCEDEVSTTTRIAVELLGIAFLCTAAWKLAIMFQL